MYTLKESNDRDVLLASRTNYEQQLDKLVSDLSLPPVTFTSAYQDLLGTCYIEFSPSSRLLNGHVDDRVSYCTEGTRA